MTAPRNQGIRSCRRDETSSVRAVAPVTEASTSVPSSAAGIVSCRRCSSSWPVRASCGDVVGVTPMIAMSRASLVTAWSTEATPGWSASAVDTSVMVALEIVAPLVSSTTSSGPLVPGP